MDIGIETVGEVTVIEMRGEYLDASVTERFKQDIGPVLAEYRKVVFDMNRLHFVDSAGLGALLSCLRRLSAEGGDLKLCGMSKQVRSVFEIARLHRIFDILPTREEAVDAFNDCKNDGTRIGA